MQVRGTSSRCTYISPGPPFAIVCSASTLLPPRYPRIANVHTPDDHLPTDCYTIHHFFIDNSTTNIFHQRPTLSLITTSSTTDLQNKPHTQKHDRHHANAVLNHPTPSQRLLRRGPHKSLQGISIKAPQQPLITHRSERRDDPHSTTAVTAQLKTIISNLRASGEPQEIRLRSQRDENDGFLYWYPGYWKIALRWCWSWPERYGEVDMAAGKHCKGVDMVSHGSVFRYTYEIEGGRARQWEQAGWYLHAWCGFASTVATSSGAIVSTWMRSTVFTT